MTTGSRHERFAALHGTGTFLIVNAPDAATAAVAEARGAPAVATSSFAQVAARALSDGEGALGRKEGVALAASMVSAVDIPVSVDAENGWGHEPEEVAETVGALASVGVSGATIEDWSGDKESGFYDRARATARIVAAVEAARALDHPFVVCARAEAFLWGVENPLSESLARLQSFSAAGADLLYAPGPSDKETLRTIASEAGGPVNILIGLGSKLTMADAVEIGARRVSVGGSLYRAGLAYYDKVIAQLISEGTFETSPPPMTGAELARLFASS